MGIVKCTVSKVSIEKISNLSYFVFYVYLQSILIKI